MKKVKQVIHDIAVATISVALSLMLLCLSIAGAAWGMTLLLRTLGVI